MKSRVLVLSLGLVVGMNTASIATDQNPDLEAKSKAQTHQSVGNKVTPPDILMRMTRLSTAFSNKLSHKAQVLTNPDLYKTLDTLLGKAVEPLRPLLERYIETVTPEDPSYQVKTTELNFVVLVQALELSKTAAPLLNIQVVDTGNMEEMNIARIAKVLDTLEEMVGLKRISEEEIKETIPGIHKLHETMKGTTDELRPSNLILRVCKLAESLASKAAKSTNPLEKALCAALLEPIIEASHRFSKLHNEESSSSLRNPKATIDFVNKIEPIIIADCRALAVRLAPVLKFDMVAPGQEDKLLLKVLSKLERIAGGEQATPNQTSAQAEPKAEAKTRNIILTPEQLTKYNKPLGELATRYGQMFRRFKAPAEQLMATVTDPKESILIRAAIKFFETSLADLKPHFPFEEFENGCLVRIGHEQLEAYSRHLQNKLLCFGFDLADAAGLEIIEDSIDYRLKLTAAVFKKLERILKP